MYSVSSVPRTLLSAEHLIPYPKCLRRILFRILLKISKCEDNCPWLSMSPNWSKLSYRKCLHRILFKIILKVSKCEENCPWLSWLWSSEPSVWGTRHPSMSSHPSLNLISYLFARQTELTQIRLFRLFDLIISFRLLIFWPAPSLSQLTCADAALTHTHMMLVYQNLTLIAETCIRPFDKKNCHLQVAWHQ